MHLTGLEIDINPLMVTREKMIAADVKIREINEKM